MIEIMSGISIYRNQGGSLGLEFDMVNKVKIKNYRDVKVVMNSFTVNECGRINNEERLVVYKVKNNEINHKHQLLEYIINRTLGDNEEQFPQIEIDLDGLGE